MAGDAASQHNAKENSNASLQRAGSRHAHQSPRTSTQLMVLVQSACQAGNYVKALLVKIIRFQ
jgi:hypothetical protein